MIRCNNCGYENSDGNYLCARCQERLPRHESSVQQAYSQATYEHNRQVEEAQKSIYKKVAIAGVIIFLIVILAICIWAAPRVDSRLTGTWRQNHFPYTTWVFTKDGKVSMSVTADEVIDGGSTKYRAEDGKITLWYHSSRFETVYTYQFGTVTDESGNTHEVLILNGGDLILFKVK